MNTIRNTDALQRLRVAPTAPVQPGPRWPVAREEVSPSGQPWSFFTPSKAKVKGGPASGAGSPLSLILGAHALGSITGGFVVVIGYWLWRGLVG